MTIFLFPRSSQILRGSDREAAMFMSIKYFLLASFLSLTAAEAGLVRPIRRETAGNPNADVNPTRPAIDNGTGSNDNNEPGVATTSSVTRQSSGHAGMLELVSTPVNTVNTPPGDSMEQKGAVLEWTKGDVELPACKHSGGMFVAKVPHGSKLVISSTDAEHEDTYLCEAHLPRSPIVLNIVEEVSSSIPASPGDIGTGDGFIGFETIPEDATVTKGTNLVLTCSASASHHIFWEKDGQRLVYDKRVYPLFGDNLLVGNARVCDSGTYSCVTYSEDGIMQSKVSAQLIVASVLEVSDIAEEVSDCTSTDEEFSGFQTAPEDATISDGTDHILSCSASDSDHVFWEKDDQRLVYNERVYLLFGDNLLVGNARVRDSGRYSCVAYSEDGTKLGTVSAQLTVTSFLDVSDVCGIVRATEATNPPRPRDNYRIVNGERAKKGSSPWMARLWHRGLFKHFCGGSLINSRWVVTAANCFTTSNYDAADIEVHLGDHDSNKVESSEMKFRISRIMLYEDFNPRTYDGDIALLELDQHVTAFTDYVSPICLPNLRISNRLLVPQKEARVVGWGQVIEGVANHRFLREVYVPIVPEDTCRESDSSSFFTDNMFCAGYRQASQGDACQGDSGGPLAMKKGGKWYLLGVISWGEGCDREGKYGFYTKVVNFIPWMTDVMT